jgi:uracil-DNA glycosylase
MYGVSIHEPDGLAEFRAAARNLIAAGAEPDRVTWQCGPAVDLFGHAAPPETGRPLSVPAGCLSLAEDVICHCEPERFALLYRLLWRIASGERTLLLVASDPLVHRLRRMQKSVARDRHKMTAFVRFRCVQDEQGERFVAWFEPQHHILRHVSSFFVDRFASMRWSILTPLGALHFDGRTMSLGPAVSREHAPKHDDLEVWWRSYYRSTFNPARTNPQAMRAEMPKKYWRHMPEAALIPDLLAEAGRRTRTMIEAPAPKPRAVPGWQADAAPAPEAGTLDALKAEAQACRRCPLWKPATQLVFGEGPSDAPMVFVGEQPGDREDLAGRPFIGPAGQMFDRALADAGIDRGRVYVTNAVKHFKYEPRGKRRLDKNPSAAEIDHCRWWVEGELSLIRPQLTVALGASAARAMTGRSVAVSRERGRVAAFAGGRPGLITVHPSYLLRLPDPTARGNAYARFVEDLRVAGRAVPAALARAPAPPETEIGAL